MKPAARALTLLALVAVVACAACWFTARYLHRQEGKMDAHAWIHTQLGITHEQHEALEPIEERYAEQKKHFTEMLRIANDELGKAILEDRSDSPRVKAAVARLSISLKCSPKAGRMLLWRQASSTTELTR